MTALDLTNIPHSKVELSNTKDDRGRHRGNLIKDIAYIDGKVIVSGMAVTDSPANIREIPFPFVEANAGASIEIYHGNHRKIESREAQSIVPLNIGGEPSVLAGFGCTPLVRFSVSSLKPGEPIHGTTVAELGGNNGVLDMIAYKKDGQDWLLVANQRNGVWKVSAANIGRADGLDKTGKEGGQAFGTIETLKNVVQLDRQSDIHAVVLIKSDNGHDLRTVPLP